MRGIVKNHEKGLNCQVNKRANRTVPADASALLAPISWPYVLIALEVGKNHKVPFSHFINFALMHQQTHVVFTTGEAFNASDASETGCVLWKGLRLMHTNYKPQGINYCLLKIRLSYKVERRIKLICLLKGALWHLSWSLVLEHKENSSPAHDREHSFIVPSLSERPDGNTPVADK